MVEAWLPTVFSILLVVVPAYTANGMALILGGGSPLDGGKSLPDRNRILGDGKTVRGTASGILFGVLAAFAVSLTYSFMQAGSCWNFFLAGSASSIGAVVGDLAGSFSKRRFNIPPGHPVPFLDQLDFISIALLFAYLANLRLGVIQFTALMVLIIIVVTPFAHITGNFIAYKAGKKRHPW